MSKFAANGSQVPYQYEIKFEVVIQSQPVDLSTYVGAVILTHSIAEVQPKFTISINSQMLESLNSNYNYAILTINSYLENNSLLSTNVYKLIPYTMVSKTYQSNAAKKSFFDASMTTIHFLSMSCYQILNSPISDTILFNTNINAILNKIKPRNCDYILDNNLDSNNIQQIHIPQQSFYGALQYVKYWHGYYPGTTIITAYPNSSTEDDSSANIRIKDIHKNITSGNTNFSVIQVLAGGGDPSNLMQQYQANSNKPTIVCTNVISYQSEVPKSLTVSNYNVVTKPLDDLYSAQKYGINIISDYGVTQGEIDTTTDNAAQLVNNSVQNIYNHTGTGSGSSNWFTSNITEDMAYTNSANIMVNQKIIYGSIWAGQLFNLVISDINAQKHSGIYLLDEVSFQLVSRGVSWDLGIHLLGVRSNFINNEVS